MAEAWLDEEEEELRDLRDSAGNRRHRRSNLNQAAERPERNKPEHRFPGQGPLSSIRAVIKRTSRTSTQSDQQRERRRPEITIVAAEPIGPGSWFHGGPAGGLGFPPPPPPQWRPSDPHPVELPPSYEQVIKEIGQVQVATTQSNVEPRRTTTCATQTDFQVEEDQNVPNNNVIVQTAFCQVDPPSVQRRLELSQQSFVNNNVKDSASQITVCNTTHKSIRQQEANVNVVRQPVPRPRTKSCLKPVLNNNLNVFTSSSEEFFLSAAEGQLPTAKPCSGFDDNFVGDLLENNNMSHERSQNSIVSRIKAFESQAESSEQSRRPEIAPRSVNTKSSVPAKPIPAPKPLPNRISGEWDPGKDNKPKVTPREGLVAPRLQDQSGTTKPDLPKKPKPSLVKDNSNEFLNVTPGASSTTNNNKDAERKVPVPAPRPLIPRKPPQADNAALLSSGPRPPGVPPKLSVATQAKAFTVAETTVAKIPAPPVQNKPSGDMDLISFDDDVLPPAMVPSPEFTSNAILNADLFELFGKDETVEKEQQPVPATVVRKPTVIRIPGKLGKSSEEVPQIPPPLPAEKPVGSLYNKSSARPRPIGRKEWEQAESAEDSRPRLVLPTRPVGVKVMEANPPPPQKGPPGRPPPPKVTKPREAFPRSSSDVGLSAKHNTSGISRSKSQVIKRQQPDLPPRPKPGHPLYSKYVLPLPHGIAEKDIVSNNPGELSLKRGEVLVLLEQTDNNYIQCQKGSATGEVQISNMKIITPLESLEHKQKEICQEDSQSPHALVLHDFIGDHPDDLSLTSGDIVYVLERLDHEWYRGKCKGSTGIFPANHVRVLVDIPDKMHSKIPSSTSISKGPRCMARFEFIGDQKDELSFSEGELIALKEYINDEWAKGELKGKTGIFPINFVEIIEDLPASGPNKFTSDVGNSQKNKLSGPVAQNSTSEEWGEALYDFAAEAEDDLPFKKGDKILLLERLDAEWYKGRLNGREGMLPAAFVQISSGMKPRQTQGGKTGKARALYDFCGENADELSFKAGDIISSLESVDNDWMSGELNGRLGIFPKDFVQRC
ncbi:SH3 domain-containing protein 19 isoform X2 [Spea bombifrons]|uniref:SH3 domain-containing protein 19 isoform X2 n=1 Tax=Spea bombifrons TaxID=233779 RepID=UPI00234B85AE|nr:SH3 domain-containing protein 19 isoform X2 [Spea bombifrons]